MFFKNFSAGKGTRKFAYTPYFYKSAEEQDEQDGHRIRFRRIRSGANVSNKSVRGMLLLVLLLIVFLAYFWQMVARESRTYDIESVRIEETE